MLTLVAAHPENAPGARSRLVASRPARRSREARRPLANRHFSTRSRIRCNATPEPLHALAHAVGPYGPTPRAYQYGYGSPLKYQDPDGQFAIIPVLIGAAVVGAGLYATYEYFDNQPAAYSRCVQKCIEETDPTDELVSGFSVALGPLPKSVVGPLTGARVSRTYGASRMTTLPSAASQRLGMGTGNWLRGAGRWMSRAVVLSGLVNTAVVSACVTTCEDDGTCSMGD